MGWCDISPPEGIRLPPMNFHGLMNMWLVVAPHHMMPHFSMFQDGRELDSFPRERKKYNGTERIMKIVEMADKRYGGWERD